MNMTTVLPSVLAAATVPALGLGLYFAAAHALRLPAGGAAGPSMALRGPGKKNRGAARAAAYALAARLAPHVKMGGYRRRKTAATLQAAGMGVSPEMHHALALAGGLMYLVPGLAAFVLRGITGAPLAVPGWFLAVMAVLSYMKALNGAEAAARARRGKIERALPRFVAHVAETVKASRDIRLMFEAYMRYNKGALADELAITHGDMASGNTEIALSRLDARISSPLLSQVTRGLIGIHRGDDGLAYFANLGRDFKNLEFQALRKLAMKRPPKIRRCSFFLLFALMAMLLGVMASSVAETAGLFF